MLTAPEELLAGGQSAVTLLVFDSETHQALIGNVKLELVAADNTVSLLFSGLHYSAVNSRISFDVPQVASGVYTLRAVLGRSTTLQVQTSVKRTPALLIETDKPIYRPSQIVQGRVVRLNNDLSPSAGPVELIFLDGKGIRIDRQQLQADEYGVAPFSLQLASELNEGVWRIRAVDEGVESVRDIRVEKYVLPRFEVDLEFEREWALVSEEVRGTVQADFFFGKEVQGTVQLVASRWVGVWEEYARLEGALEQGRWDFQLPAVNFVTGTPQSGGQGSVRVDVSVTDTTGHTQTVSDSLIISRSAVVFSLTPVSETIKPGIPFQVMVESASPDGRPVDSRVLLTATFSDYGGRDLSVMRTDTTTGNGALVWTLEAPAGTAFGDFDAASGPAETSIRVGASYSPTESYLSLFRLDGSGPASVGQTLQFQVISSSSATTYYEVFAGGRTVFSAFTESDTFSFPVTVEMVPSAKVVAYRINDNNEVIADSLSFDTHLPLAATVEAGFDLEQVKPGDPVEVTLDTGLGRRALLGVSIVDRSVLALGRSRLHLQEVFEELERRFLEPKAEVHFEDEPGIPFFAPIPTPGSAEVFAESGLVVDTTDNLNVPQGQTLRFIDILPILSPPEAGGGAAAAAPETPRLRQYFPETWVWEPQILTDEDGRATLTLQAPDSITGWHLTVVATQPESSDEKPGILFGESDLTVFQDFFIEPSLPYSVVRDERFPLKIAVFNYLSEEQDVEISLGEVEGIELLNGDRRTVSVPANSAVSTDFPLRPLRVGEFPLHITAIGSSGADAVLRQLRVIPEGAPAEEIENSILKAGEVVSWAAAPPPQAVEDSVRAFLSLTPSPVGQTLKGVSDLLEMPYGCGEQNMIFLAPDVEILKYLREIGELSPEIRIEAEFFINTGYQRQLTYQTDDGGFAAFGGAEGSLWLTAFVLSTFSGAREVRDIDELVLSRAAEMLMSRQNEDGSFEPDDFLIHTEMDGGIANLYSLAAYVVNALADYGGAEVSVSLERAGEYLAGEWQLPEIHDNAYALAVSAVALQKVDGFQTLSESIIDRLLELAIATDSGIHWEPFPVETTGYATIALLQSDGGTGRVEAQAALDWLTTQRNSLGGYGTSTQDTVVALRALFLAARKVRRDVSVQVRVLGAGEVLMDIRIDDSNFDVLHQVAVPADGSPVELSSVGKGTVGYQFSTRYNLPAAWLPPPQDLIFEVTYDTEHIEVDDIIDVQARLLYTGFKERTGMVIADVALPTGFESVRTSLDRLVEQGTVQRVEEAGRKLIFYIESLERDTELRFEFQIRALYPVRAAEAISQAYAYYDSAIRAFHVSPAIEIVDPSQPVQRNQWKRRVRSAP